MKEINNYPVEITKENKDAQLVIGILAVKLLLLMFFYIFHVSKTYRKHFSQKTEKSIPMLKHILGLFFIIGFS